MSVYCEPIDYHQITAALGDSRPVLLVGCPLCANMSCAVRIDPQSVRIVPFTVHPEA